MNIVYGSMAEIVSGIAIFLAITFDALITWRIRKYHYEKWQNLGSPGYLHNPTEYGSLKLADYIRKKGWVELNDPVIHFLFVMSRLSFAVAVVGFIAIIFY